MLNAIRLVDLKASSVFLDCFGVIADSEVMAHGWRRIEATILKERFGGSLAKWMKAHDETFRWYMKFWSRHGPRSRAEYRGVFRRVEVEWMRRTLLAGGVNVPKSERELFELDRKLIYAISSRVDPFYLNTSEILRKLKRKGARLFLVSGADSVFVSGLLEGSDLADIFEDTFSPDELNAFKGSMKYWKKILKISNSSPRTSLAVDDSPRALEIPARLGLQAILVGRHRVKFSRYRVIGSIEELPSIVD